MEPTDPAVTEAVEMDETERREAIARALAEQDFEKLAELFLAAMDAEITEDDEPLSGDERAILDLMRLCAKGLDRNDSDELVARAWEIVETGRRLLRESAITYLA